MSTSKSSKQPNRDEAPKEYVLDKLPDFELKPDTKIELIEEDGKREIVEVNAAAYGHLYGLALSSKVEQVPSILLFKCLYTWNTTSHQVGDLQQQLDRIRKEAGDHALDKLKETYSFWDMYDLKLLGVVTGQR